LIFNGVSEHTGFAPELGEERRQLLPRKQRKLKVSRDEIREAADALDKVGELLLFLGELGDIDKKFKKLDKVMTKILDSDPLVLFPRMDETTMTSIMASMMRFSSVADKDPVRMRPDEQREAGRALKELSSLFNKLAEGME